MLNNFIPAVVTESVAKPYEIKINELLSTINRHEDEMFEMVTRLSNHDETIYELNSTIAHLESELKLTHQTLADTREQNDSLADEINKLANYSKMHFVKWKEKKQANKVINQK